MSTLKTRKAYTKGYDYGMQFEGADTKWLLGEMTRYAAHTREQMNDVTTPDTFVAYMAGLLAAFADLLKEQVK